MTWFHSKGGEQQKRPQDRLVSSEEIQSAFTEQRDFLYWVRLLITGDKTAPEQAVVDGNKRSGFRGGVFRDWLIVRANHATLRTAVAGAFSESTPTMKCFPTMRSGRFVNTTRLGCRLRTLLDVSRRIVVGAYCQALRWLPGTCGSNLHGRNREDPHE